MPRHGPPDHTGPEAVAGLAKRRAKRNAEPIVLVMRFDGSAARRQLWSIDRAFRALMREKRRRSVERLRIMRGLPPRPGWIDADPPTLAFPGWGPRWRPFDWRVDA